MGIKDDRANRIYDDSLMCVFVGNEYLIGT